MAALVHTVPADAGGTRLDRYLASIPEVGTRAQGRLLIDRGQVRVDGAVRKPAFAVTPGMRVEVDVRAPAPLAVEPEPIELSVLYEDEALVVVDKPAGMVVHPAAGAREGTLVSALLHRYGHLAGGARERPGIVHRLDRDTSGVLVVARTLAAHEHLARQFRERLIDKRYLALARGRVARETGDMTWGVGRHPHERKRMSTASRRPRAAVTHYRVVERLPGATLLDVRPHTGRTHQIRVHLAALGHPLVGDRVYGGRGSSAARRGPWAEVLASCPRQALHAASLAFTHPVSARRVTVTAPLPPDLRQVLDGLRRCRAVDADAPRG